MATTKKNKKSTTKKGSKVETVDEVEVNPVETIVEETETAETEIVEAPVEEIEQEPETESDLTDSDSISIMEDEKDSNEFVEKKIAEETPVQTIDVMKNSSEKNSKSNDVPKQVDPKKSQDVKKDMIKPVPLYPKKKGNQGIIIKKYR